MAGGQLYSSETGKIVFGAVLFRKFVYFSSLFIIAIIILIAVYSQNSCMGMKNSIDKTSQAMG